MKAPRGTVPVKTSNTLGENTHCLTMARKEFDSRVTPDVNVFGPVYIETE
jgi:hypothetical protein